jgi:hypothetical protein
MPSLKYEVLTAVNTKGWIFWDVTLCNLVYSAQQFYHEEGGSRFFLNIGTFVPSYIQEYNNLNNVKYYDKYVNRLLALSVNIIII